MTAKALSAGFQRMAQRALAPAGRVQRTRHEVQAPQGGLLGREVASGPDRAPVAGVPRVDRVGRADDLSDLDVVVQERHELGPGVLPQRHDGPILATPGRGELGNAFLGGGFGRGGVDRPQVTGDLLPVLPAGVPEAVAQQMDDARLDPSGPVWTVVNDHTFPTASGRPLRPSQTRMQTSAIPRFFSSVSTDSTDSQKLGALAAVAGPQAEDVAFAVHSDADGCVDGSVGDLPVADLHHDGVEGDDRVDAIERP